MTWMLAGLLILSSVPEGGERLTRAKAMLDALNKGDYEAVAKHFDKTMREKMPAEKSKELWQGLTKQVGEFKKVERTETLKAGTSNIVDLICQFDKMLLKLRVSFDKDDQIQGFFLLPATALKFDPPPYAKKESFREEKLTIGEGSDWPLPALLTLPTGTGPFPCVVLVHGSGPHDGDETIGPNKPFRDLAWGLATQGIASLRYAKRTYAHPAKVLESGSVNLDNEVIDDAVVAVKELSKRKEIDPQRIFVVGHSLGALVAPRIGKKAPNLAGLILLAGNSRPLEDLVLEQFTYLYSLDGGPTEEQKKELAELKKKVERVKQPFTADLPSSELPLGMPASYWRSLKDYDPTATAAKLSLPMLILQGERDYQVTMDDFDGWKKALAKRGNVKMKSYPALNHLFMTGKGKAKPTEYGQAGHVSREVIDDLAKWILEPR